MRKKTAWILASVVALGIAGVTYAVYDGRVNMPELDKMATSITPPWSSEKPKSDVATPRAKPSSPLIMPVRHASNPIPSYPEGAMRRHEEGTVLLNVHVGQDGGVKEAKVLQTSGSPRLDKAAMRTVSERWRYVPAHRNGKPVAAWQKVKITFTCQSGKQDICTEAF